MVQFYHHLLNQEQNSFIMNIIQYENYQEKRDLQEYSFPYLTYLCSIPLDFLRVPLHWHDEMELIYIKKGRGLVSVDFQPYEVDAGMILVICPGQLHAIEQLHQEAMEYENIIFSFALLNSRHPDFCWERYLSPIHSRQVRVPVLLSPEQALYQPIAACLDQIDEIRRTFPEAYELLTKGKLFELFFYLYACRETTIDGSTPKSLDKTRQILKYIEQHYNEKITIKKVAEACGFSQSHFMKFFKQTIGTPFTAYLNDYRLTMASRLLLSSEASILFIAGETGFDNLSYFNRVFKQRFGMTPREFRRQTHRQDHPIKSSTQTAP